MLFELARKGLSLLKVSVSNLQEKIKIIAGYIKL